MDSIRRRVRAVAFAWLLCQVASLSAFVPELCCVSHAAEAAAKEQAAAEACHEAPASTPAPEPKEGDACPMHHGTQSHGCCTITNACDGPSAHLAALFAYIGVPELPATQTVTMHATAAFIPAPEPLLYQLSVPDAPPPKR